MHEGIISAVWHDGKSAASHPVRLECRNDTLAILPPPANTPSEPAESPSGVTPATPGAAGGSPLAIWELSAMSVLSGSLHADSPSRHGLEPVRLGLIPDDGQRLVLRDPDAVARMASWYAEPHKRRRRTRLTRWVQGTLLVWAIGITLYLASPFLFALAAAVIPQSWEEALGKSSQETVLRTLKFLPGTRSVCPEGAAQPDLTALMRHLEKGAPTSGYTFRLTVLDADFVNAFALPGGYMVVSTGLIRDCKSPDELAGVLAHEMAHVTERHGTSRMLRYYTWSTLLQMMGGSDSLTGSMALSVVTSSMDRDDERAADRLGAERLVGAGISPEGLASFFARLQKEESDMPGMFSYIASHPGLAERRDSIRSILRQYDAEKRTFAPSLDKHAWQRVQGVCTP